MEEITTTKGVCEVLDLNNYIVYKTTCDCLFDEHNHTLVVSIEDNDTVTLDISFKAYKETPDYRYPWYVRLLGKFKACYDIIFKGCIEVDSEFIFSGEEHIESYIKALKEAMYRVKANKEKEKTI